MPIEDRNLEPGTHLAARYKKQDRTCEVVRTDDGLRFRLDDGTMHKSPSSAGKAVIGHACNGWVFWSVEGMEKPPREPKATTEKPVKTKKEPAAKKPAKAKVALKESGAKKKGKASEAGATSDDSYGCGVCPDTFPTMAAATEHALTHTTVG